MKQLQLRNGDLVVGPGGFAMVGGSAKVQQDLGAALREPLGDDRFHPQFGTVLAEALGGVVDSTTQTMIQSEVSRIIANYMAVQTDQITSDALAGVRSRYSPGEIISSVNSVDVQQSYDRVNVKIVITTVQGDTLSILRSVGV